MYKHIQMCSNNDQYVQICTNMYNNAKILANLHKCVQICTNMYNYDWICINMYQHIQTYLYMYSYIQICAQVYNAMPAVLFSLLRSSAQMGNHRKTKLLYVQWSLHASTATRIPTVPFLLITFLLSMVSVILSYY